MGKGIQITKPDYVSPVSGSVSRSEEPLHSFYYALLGLTFPAALVALFFFLQTRSV